MDSGVPKTQTKEIIILEILIILSALFRLLFSSTEVIYPDACTYLSISKSILNGKLSTDFRGGVELILPPLYPLMTSLFYLLFRSIELSALMVSIFTGSLLIVPAYFLTGLIYGKKAARNKSRNKRLISAAFIFFSPVMINWSVAMYTEALFILLFISAITIGLYALEREKGIWFFVTGSLVGLSYLTRIPGIIVLGILCGWIIIYLISKRFSVRKSITFTALLFAGFILITGPYLAHLHSALGEWTLTGSYGSVTEVVMDEGVETVAGWELLDVAKKEEGAFKKLSKKTTANLRHYSYSLFKMLSVTLLFVIIGIIRGCKGLLNRDEIIKSTYLLSFVILYFLSLLILPVSPLIDERMRYLSPILPILLILASGGIVHANTWIEEYGKGKLWRSFAIPAMIVIVLVSYIPQYQMVSAGLHKFWEKERPVDIRKETGKWMKDNLPPPIRAMSRGPFVPYHADGIFFLTPPTYEAVIRTARANNIDYLILDRDVDYDLRPKLKFLFNPARIPEELKLIGGYTHPTTGEILMAVYKIRR